MNTCERRRRFRHLATMAQSAFLSGWILYHARPVVLAAKGGETKSFTVALVRVHNRLTNMRAGTFAPGRDWRQTVLNPPFDPMHLYYQAFFEAAPEKAGDLFVKLMPAGDPGVNHLLLDFEAPAGVTLVPFCRHPEEYMIAESDPIYMVLLGAGPKGAVPLSKATILGGAIGNFLTLSRARHPKAERPMIDYEASTFMQSGELLGVVFGVLLNGLLPAILIIVFLLAILSYNSYKTFAKGFAARA